MPSRDRPLKVLISGAGIAGPVLAWWLHQGENVEVTVLERFGQLRREGQTINVRSEGLQVIQQMGIEDKLRNKRTHEKGLQFVDGRGMVWGTFLVNGDVSFTSDLQISRGDLAQCLFDSCKDLSSVKFVFGETIASMTETPDSLKVTFSSDGQEREYDLLVIAEGLKSHTRALAFKEDLRAGVQFSDTWIGSFSVPADLDDSTYSRVFSAPGGKGIMVRPNGRGRVGVNLIIQAVNESAAEEMRIMSSSKTTLVAQKAYFKEAFKTEEWETSRFVRGLDDAKDFYVQEVGKSARDSWSIGRVALVGDAAYCPTARTGKGTTVAIAGAYVLASEILKHRHDHRAAFEGYEKSLRPWITDIQNFPAAIALIFGTKTATGIYIRNWAMFIISSLIRLPIVKGFVGRFVMGGKKAFELPSFERFQKA